MADRVVVLRQGLVRQVGTPKELHDRPGKADVAGFMGYRNILPARMREATGGRATVEVAGAVLTGTIIEQPTTVDAVVAIRPDDLMPAADGPISANVETIEYHGDDFYGVARTRDGVQLFFRSKLHVSLGEALTLSAPADRVLIYAAQEQK